jgi:hypothetical protein
MEDLKKILKIDKNLINRTRKIPIKQETKLPKYSPGYPETEKPLKTPLN